MRQTLLHYFFVTPNLILHIKVFENKRTELLFHILNSHTPLIYQFEEILLEIGFVEEMATIRGNKEVP